MLWRHTFRTWVLSVSVAFVALTTFGPTVSGQNRLLDAICHHKHHIDVTRNEACVARIFPLPAKRIDLPLVAPTFEKTLSNELAVGLAISKVQTRNSNVWSASPNALVLGHGNEVTVMPYAFILTPDVRRLTLINNDFIATMYFKKAESQNDRLSALLTPPQVANPNNGNLIIRTHVRTGELLKSESDSHEAKNVLELENAKISAEIIRSFGYKTPVFVVHKYIQDLHVRFVTPMRFAGIFNQGVEPGSLLLLMTGINHTGPLDDSDRDLIIEQDDASFGTLRTIQLASTDLVECTFLELVPPLNRTRVLE